MWGRGSTSVFLIVSEGIADMMPTNNMAFRILPTVEQDLLRKDDMEGCSGLAEVLRRDEVKTSP